MNHHTSLGNLEKDKTFLKTIIGLIVIYSLFIFYVFWHIEAKSYDERWFYSISQGIRWHHSVKNLLLTENYLGYGAIYWIIIKILHSFFVVRMVWAIMIISIPICTCILCRKVLNFSMRNIFFSILIYFSCPLVWFTGKIIGPEILGQALGCWGISTILIGHFKEKSYCLIIGVFLVGLATGVKLYNFVFYIFSMFYIFLDFLAGKSYKKILVYIIIIYTFVLCCGFLCGYGAGNVWSAVGGGGGALSIRCPLKHILFSEQISWDLINVGGLNRLIMHVPCLAAIFILSKKTKKKIAGILSIFILLLAVCFKSYFSGWYLFPLIIIISICVPDSFLMFPILILNLIFMFAPLSYQIESKIEQIQNIKNIDIINLHIRNWEKNYNKDYKKNYFVEFVDKPYSFLYQDEAYEEKNAEKQLLFFSRRSLVLSRNKYLFLQAKNNQNGYKLVDYRDGVFLVQFERE